MKNMLNCTLLCMSMILFTTCFKVLKPDEEPTLPPITMEGKNTMGCTINGEIFTVSGKQIRGSWLYKGTYAIYQLNITTFYVIGKQNKPNQMGVTINLQVNEDQTIYELNNKELSVGYVRMWVDDHIFADTHFSTNNEFKGRVEILKLEYDKVLKEGFVAGLFEFDAIDSRGEVIQVREGRFDLSFGW